MKNKECLALIDQGSKVWNKWRTDNPEREPDFSEAKLSEKDLSFCDLKKVNLQNADLRGADLQRANLLHANLEGAHLNDAFLYESDVQGANFQEADLQFADLEKANLNMANLQGANLQYTNLQNADLTVVYLSGAIINEYTKCKDIKGCKRGINGLYCKETDSAALMSMIPPGDSMLGASHISALESLKRARRIHGSSLALVGIVVLIIILNLKELTYQSYKITPSMFGFLAMILSLALMSLVKSFMSDALRGARYLHDRDSAMTVGNFPWAMSKYARINFITKMESLIFRFIMSFHSMVYIYFWDRWTDWGNWGLPNNVIFISLLILLFVVSTWTFIISQKFQKPILFDRKTEEKRQDSFAISSEATENHMS